MKSIFKLSVVLIVISFGMISLSGFNAKEIEKGEKLVKWYSFEEAIALSKRSLEINSHLNDSAMIP